MSDRLEILCPDCNSLLVIHKETGAILEHKAAAPKKTFEDIGAAISALRSADQVRERKFAASIEREKSRSERLSAQFEEMIKLAEKDDGSRPKNPLDFD